MPRMGRVPNENRGRNQKPVPVILYIYIQNSSSNPFVNSFNAHKISTIKHILPR